VEALVRELLPEATVSAGEPVFPSADGVSVHLDGTPRWLLLTPRLAAKEVAQAFGAGAWTVVPLDSPHDDLRRALESLVAGDTPFVPRAVGQHITRRGTRRRGGDGFATLTAREAAVLDLLARGCSNAEIAAQLTMSENTVRTHLHTLSSKLHAQNRVKLVARARDEGLVEPFD
jgi:DNA-binding NarL/FixJ family response regulator